MKVQGILMKLEKYTSANNQLVFKFIAMNELFICTKRFDEFLSTTENVVDDRPTFLQFTSNNHIISENFKDRKNNQNDFIKKL